jgi:hypothetical protein
LTPESAGTNGRANDKIGPLEPFPLPAEGWEPLTEPDLDSLTMPEHRRVTSPEEKPRPAQPMNGGGPTAGRPRPGLEVGDPAPAGPSQPWTAVTTDGTAYDLRSVGDIAALLDRATRNLEDVSQEFPRSVMGESRSGRWLRKLIGVDESLLARVWEERARYTGLGAIVLGTAVMAAISMFDALNEALGPVWPVLILVALFWGTLICCIDRWLIASTHGAHAARWRIFVPRLALSVLFGVIIATPLVLTIFGSEVVTRAATDQQNNLTKYESQLKACNPLPDPATGVVPAAPASCAGHTLPVSDPATGLTQTIGREIQQRTKLAGQVASANATIKQYDTTIRDECNGASGPGLSGIPGVGFNCKRDRQQEDTFKKDNDIAKWQKQLTDLNAEIGQQTATLGSETQTYSNNITSAIKAKVSARQKSQDRIGLLDRINALGELFAANVAIAAATVLLGLFILMVDCLPVLSKMMSGTTNYDRLVEDRLRSAAAIGAAAIRVGERRAIGADDVALYAIDSQIRARKEQIDEASRAERGRRDAEVDRKIAELTEQFRRMDY